MAGRLIGAWNPALDSSGKPISGALLHTYNAGTTTPKLTYTDATLLVPSANPVVADSAGRFAEIWAADAATYDLVWATAANVTIKTFASVQSLGSTATGAVMRDFGADGKFNLESRGGTTYLESGDADPDNIGGMLRLGGWNGTQGDTLTLDYQTVMLTGALAGTASRGAIDGLLFSTAGSSATFAISAGTATDHLGAISMVLPSAFTKTTATWAVGTGNGGLDTGVIANSMQYHAHLIRRPDSGLVDVLFSLSPTAPTLPANYTTWRRIFSLWTNGSGQWLPYVHNGDLALWSTPIGDVSGAAITSAGALKSLTVPSGSGISVEAIINVVMVDTSASANTGLIHSPLQANQTPDTPAGNASVKIVANGPASFGVRVLTNTSGQVRAITSGNATLSIATQGWIDRRGRDA